MATRFQFRRTLEASAYLLGLENGRMAYLRLLKLLYIAEREWLIEAAEPITGDRAYAMEYGPVLSTVYDLIKRQSSHTPAWDEHIRRDGYAVELVRSPGVGSLSRGVMAKLGGVSQRYRDRDQWEISDLTHDFPEWAQTYKHDRSAVLIPLDVILSAQGKAELADEIRGGERVRDALDAVFGIEP